MATDRCRMVFIFFHIAIELYFSSPIVCPYIYLQSSTDSAQTSACINNNVISSYTRFVLVDMTEGAGSRTVFDGEWKTSSIDSPLILETSFRSLSVLNNKQVIVRNKVSMA